MLSQSNDSRQPIVRRPSRLVNIGFSLVILALAAAVFIYRQDIKDWLVVQRYQPTAAVSALADNTTMTDKGRWAFYVAQPELHAKQTFSQRCQSVGDENSNVLGCYANQRIYIYDITDEQLSGVREVTAAHEMLHAAYERLGGTERQRVDRLLQGQLDSGVEPHIQELITLYNRLEPGQLLNEMHSILATEQAELAPELEDYYRQYFTDRQQVVALSDAYRAVFDDLKARQQALVQEIEVLSETINSGTTSLNAAIAAYNQSVQDFNRRAAEGSMTREQFDSERAALTATKTQLDAQRAENDNQRDQYRQKQQALESLSIEFNGLQDKVDSKPDDLTEVE